MISNARRTIVFRSIKSALLKGKEVEYWAMKMYEQLDAGVLTSEQVAELEVIIEDYYRAQEEMQEETTAEGEE